MTPSTRARKESAKPSARRGIPPINSPAPPAARAEDSPHPADNAQRRVSAQQLCQGRAQDERIEPEISRIERPTRPHDEKDGPLIARQAARKADGLLTGCAWHFLPLLSLCQPSCAQPGILGDVTLRRELVSMT